MKHYLVNIPGVAGPLKVSGYTEQEARKRLRDREGYGSRLPRGTKFYEQVEEKPSGHSHVIRFNDQSVTCHQHTNESIIELTRRYYEGQHNLNCVIVDRTGKQIYKTA